MKYAGIVVRGDTVMHGREKGPVAGAHARVETAGDIDRRITATRLVLTGPFALAFRKKKDHRELYLTVEGDGFGWVVKIDPKEGMKARKFAAEFNALASRLAHQAAPAPTPLPRPVAAPASPSTPPGWFPDPTGRHEHRYFDGTRWTEHVADAGQNRLDQL